ncbi:MAG: hypothetical protein AB1489_28615 [Acidobacteriota bacterium]
MGFFGIIKKIIFWSYERGSWQYDVLCVLILMFIFLVPARVFKERSELTYIRTVELAQASAGTNLRDLLNEVVSHKYQRKVSVKRFEIDSDPDGNIRGYRVWLD